MEITECKVSKEQIEGGIFTKGMQMSLTMSSVPCKKACMLFHCYINCNMSLQSVLGDFFFCILDHQCILLSNRPVEEEVVDKDRILQQKEAEVRQSF